jgi:hypothetical protein
MSLLKVASFFCCLRMVCSFNQPAQFESPLIARAVSVAISDICDQKSCSSGFSAIISSVDKLGSDTASDVFQTLNVPIQLEDKILELKDRKRFFVLLFVSDVKSFEKFYDQLKMENFYMSGLFTIVFPNGSSSDMETIFALLWKKFVYNVIIISQTSDQVEMFTFMPYGRAGTCGDSTRVKTNEFDVTTQEWKHKHFFPKKFKDLRGCQIRCGLFHLPIGIIVDKHPNGSLNLHGFDVDLFNELMKSINAKVNYTVYPIDTGTIYPNGTGTGLLGHTLDGHVDVSLRSYSLQLIRRKFLTETVSFSSDVFVMIMPLPGKLNPLLKLVRPLSLEAWILLSVVVVIATVAIRLIKLVPDRYYRMIFGKRMRHDYMNLLIGVFGLSQHNLPEQNFPRFLLMMYLIFCLVVRSLYLGSMFNMLKTDIRMSDYVSIKDFYDAGFSFYLYETLAERVDDPVINAR